jgi:hypothetical protein
MTMADTTAAAPPTKLPFWRTVGRAYAAPFVNFGSLVRAAWLWILLLVPVLLAISWFLAPLYTALADVSKADLDASTPVEIQLLSILPQLVVVPAVASIAATWHRLILNRERPAGAYLRFDRSVWLYAHGGLRASPSQERHENTVTNQRPDSGRSCLSHSGAPRLEG